MTADQTSPAKVLTERRGHVLLLTLNRPEARNAIDRDVWIAVGEALAAADADAEVRAIVITGAGPTFCAGADLKAVARGEAIVPDDPVQRGWGFAGIVSHAIAKPMIAAINGSALGGGTEIALACDLVVAADDASFGLPEVKRGILAGAGGAFRIVRQLPHKLGMELLLTGEPITAARAYELGFVNRIVPQGDVLETALALAETIAGNAPLSVQASKRVALGIRDGTTPDDRAGWEASEREGRRLFGSEDAREGPRAFAEKRAPVWKGR